MKKLNINIIKRKCSVILTLALAISSIMLPSETIHADAGTIGAPSTATYVEAKDFGYGMNKVYFGGDYVNPWTWDRAKHRWIVTGTETVGDTNTMVLLCDPLLPYGSSPFGEDEQYQYEGSLLDKAIQGLYAGGSAEFSAAETALMKDVNISYFKYFNRTTPGSDTETITRKMYAPNAAYRPEGCYDYDNDENILVGSGFGNVKTTIKDEPAGYRMFWLRGPYDMNGPICLVAGLKNGYIDHVSPNLSMNVVPAFNLDISNILFASSARAAQDRASFDATEPLTFRVNGSDKIESVLQQGYEGVRVIYRDADAGKDLYLCVQGTGGNEFFYSKKITESVDIQVQTIFDGASSLSADAKVWLEYKDSTDNLVYAKAPVSIGPLTIHHHKWKLSAKGSKLIAEIDCHNAKNEGYEYCEYKASGKSISLSVSAATTVSSGSSVKVTVGTEDEKKIWTEEGLGLPSIVHYKSGKKLSKAPTRVGSYTVRVVSADDSKVYVECKYSIKITKKQEKQIKDVVSKINKIGTVKYTASSKKKIDTAKKAYDKLSADQKKKVTNYSILKSAEKKYKELYDINNASYKTKSKDANIVVTSSYEKNGIKYTVTSIGKDAFRDKYVKNVILPSTIETIEDKAFYKDNKLKSIKIASKKLTVKEGAFLGVKKSTLAKLKVRVSKKMKKSDFNALRKSLVDEGLKQSNIVRK